MASPGTARLRCGFGVRNRSTKLCKTPKSKRTLSLIPSHSLDSSSSVTPTELNASLALPFKPSSVCNNSSAESPDLPDSVPPISLVHVANSEGICSSACGFLAILLSRSRVLTTSIDSSVAANSPSTSPTFSSSLRRSFAFSSEYMEADSWTAIGTSLAKMSGPTILGMSAAPPVQRSAKVKGLTAGSFSMGERESVEGTESW